MRIKLNFDHLKVGRSIVVLIKEDALDSSRGVESCPHHRTGTDKEFLNCPITILFSPMGRILSVHASFEVKN